MHDEATVDIYQRLERGEADVAGQAIMEMAQKGQGSAMLDDRLARALTSAVERHGVPAANALLSNIDVFTIPLTGEWSAKQLAEKIADYSPDPRAALTLLRWMPKLYASSVIQQKLSLQTDYDLQLLEQSMKAVFGSPMTVDYGMQEFVVAATTANPQALGIILKAAAEGAGHVNLGPTVEYLVAHNIGVDQLSVHANLIGKVARGSTAVAKHLQGAFQQQPGAVMAFLKGSGRNLAEHTDVLEQTMLMTPAAELPTVIRELDALSPKEYWPRRIVTALLCRRDVDLNVFVNSKNFPSLYRNIVQHFSSSIAGVQADAFDPVPVLSAIVRDSGFETLEASAIADLARALGDLPQQGMLAPVKVAILERMDWRSNLYFSERFFVGVAQHRFDPSGAARLLDRMVELGRNPFSDASYLAALLCSIDRKRRNTFLLRRLGRFMTSASDKEQLFTLLAQERPEGFAYFYVKNKGRIWSNQYYQSDRQKEIYRTCWMSLRFWEQLKTMFWPF